MPNDILKQIVDCVHAQKINNKDELQLETHWSHVDLLADAVLAIIDMCRRPSLTPSAANGDASTVTTKKTPKIGLNTCCPKHPLKGKENVLPPPALPSAASTSMAEPSPPNSPPSGPFQLRAPHPTLTNAVPTTFSSPLATSSSIRPNIFYYPRTVNDYTSRP